MKYNWQQNDWPCFCFSLSGLDTILHEISHKIGHTSGILKSLPNHIQSDTIIDLMVTEAMKTSEIEGEFINRDDVMSSIRNHLGINKKTIFVRDKRAQGIAELMINLRDTYSEPLSETMLFSWHKMLMQGSSHINTGMWRTHTEAMQIVSNISHQPKVHFEAPPSKQVAQEMKHFIHWFNNKKTSHPVVRSAITHLYFETIHPFEDGNGRIGRALSEKALSQDLGRPILISLSKTIEENKKEYYNALEQAQKSNEITPWVTYFTNMVLSAQNEANTLIDFVLKKTKFIDYYASQLNAAQDKVIQRMLREGVKGFEGGMTAKKYSLISDVSKPTATRHLAYLTKIGALSQEGVGKNTKYHLNL